MVEVRWTRPAVADLDAIGEYLERSSPEYARALVRRLYTATDALADYPQMGRVVPEFEVEHVRELVREGYRVVYLLAPEDRVEVLAVLHGRQDLRKKLRRE